jgi:Do/DeqQ family serine protease
MTIILRLLGCLAVWSALVSAAPAQNARVPSSPSEIKLSFAPAVKRVTPAVVNVYAARIIENRVPLFDDPVFRRFFGGSSGPREQVQRSLGSGVIVDASGLVVTNNHVIENADQIKVALADKREFDAVLVLKDERSDLAVLRIMDGRERFTAVDFGDSDALEVGDVVLAVGNPFGVGQTVTHGIVSAVARTQVGITDYQFFIQTDAAINPGNSGGALVDIGGRLVGINTAIFSRSGGSQGIGFAIPANMVRAVVASAKAGAASVRRPWLGARLQPVTPEIAESLSLKRPVGALVNTISPRSPAARSGLRTGDLIIEVDGQPIDDPNAFDYRFATKPLGGEARVAVMRGGREVKIGIQGALTAARRQGREPVAGPRRGTAARLQHRRRRGDRRRERLGVPEPRLPEGRHCGERQQRKDCHDGGPAACHQSAGTAVAAHYPARRPGNLRRVRRMSPRCNSSAGLMLRPGPMPLP